MNFHGLPIVDIRGQLPRNGSHGSRPLSALSRIAVHWDAQFRPHQYDSIQRYVSEAQFHINKDWGGGAHGSGLEYHFKIDNTGVVFWTRALEDLLWAVSNCNYNTISICMDGTTGQAPTREQIEALGALLHELTYNHPEFPASYPDVYGHGELTACGNNTACPGSFLTEVIRFRDHSVVAPEIYAYDWGPSQYAPAAPAPAPAPAPTPVPIPKPEWETNKQDVAAATVYATKDTPFIDITTGNPASPSRTFKSGEEFNYARTTKVGDKLYLVTAYSAGKGIWKGVLASDFAPEKPKPAPNPDPKPQPAPDPHPEPSGNSAIVTAIKKLLDQIVQLLNKII